MKLAPLVLAVAVLACGASACAPSRSASSAAGACSFWGGRGYSLTVRASSSHGKQFRELAYDDKTGVVRVHDSDLFASGAEASEPRVIQRSITLKPAERDALSNELTALCPSSEELVPADAVGGGTTTLEVHTAEGAAARARFVRDQGSDVARKTLARLQAFFPELRV